MQGEIMVNDDTVFESLMKMDSAIAKLSLHAENFGRDDYEWKGTEYDDLIDEIFNDDRLEKGAPGQIKKFGEEIEVAIRIPLNSILGYTEMLMEDEHTEIKNFADDLKKFFATGFFA